MKKEKFLKKVINVYTIIGFVLIICSLALVLTPMLPYIIYRIHPSETTNEVNKLADTIEDTTSSQTTNTPSLPAIDLSLPTDPYISIPKIGVYSPISTISNYTEALRHGAWMVPNFGTPTNEVIPIIVAAHRFGYISWGITTRNKISFYNLPKTHVGDTIEIIWEQRRFTYEIYKEEEGTSITDYSANLILYTCKYFNSPTRIFRYARLAAP